MAQENKKYYSQRKNPESSVSLETLKQIFLGYLNEISDKDLLLEWFGNEDGWGNGSPGRIANPGPYVHRKLRKDLWPVWSKIDDYSEDDLLTIIEFIHDHISVPNTEYEGFNANLAQEQYRNELNPILADFGVGLELNKNGEISLVEPAGIDYLLSANIPEPATVDKELIITIDKSINKFRSRKASIDDRQSVIVELVGIFEALKKSQALNSVLNDKDESAIFEFANKFAIRHRDPQQIKNYDKDIWLSWAFYYYLATIHATLRLIQRQERLKPGEDEKWSQVLAEVRRRNTTLYGILRIAKPEVEQHKITLNFRFQFHLKRIQEVRNKQIVTTVVDSIYGKKMELDAKLVDTAIV